MLTLVCANTLIPGGFGISMRRAAADTERGEIIMATIKEIAKEAGVSPGTVDRVLHNRGRVNHETACKVNAVIDRLGFQPNQSAQGLAAIKKKLKIGFQLPNTAYHPYFADVENAARRKARELERYGIQVIFLDTDYSQLQSDEYWTSFGDRALEMDGMVLLAFPMKGARDMAQRLADRKFPVVFYNRYYSDMDFLAYVGCDYDKAGRIAAGLCALCVGEDARIAVYTEECSESFENFHTQSRRAGFYRELREHYPKMKVSEARLTSNNPIDNYISAVKLREQYPDIDAAYVMQFGRSSVYEAIRKAALPKCIPIISHDMDEGQAELMRKGMITATICQEPEKQGEQPLDILFRYLVYREEPTVKMQYTNLSIHIAQSL